MTKELEEATKVAIGYDDNPPARWCENCKNSKEKEDPFLDRAWILECHVNQVCPFVVSYKGCCSLFELKQTPGK